MVINFKYGDKAILIKHSAEWIQNEYGGKTVTLLSKFKTNKNKTIINFTTQDSYGGVMMGSPSYFKKV